MLPDAKLRNYDREYIRDLIEQTGLSQKAVASRLGITDRALRFYITEPPARNIPYCVQYSLEQLAEGLNGARS